MSTNILFIVQKYEPPNIVLECPICKVGFDFSIKDKSRSKYLSGENKKNIRCNHFNDFNLYKDIKLEIYNGRIIAFVEVEHIRDCL